MAWISVNSIGYEIRKDLSFMFVGTLVGFYLASGPLKAQYEQEVRNDYQKKTKNIYNLYKENLEDRQKIDALEEILYPGESKNEKR